jgi:endonuclease YncB( thermonuclease family)
MTRRWCPLRCDWRLLAPALLVLTAAASLAVSGCTRRETFTGQVVGIADGDTLTVMRDGRRERVRISGIDAPEGGQAFGRRSRQHLASLAFGQQATVILEGADRYGRLLGRVVVEGLDVGLEQVRQGYAWHYTRYSSDRQLAAAEREARAARRGLWADGSPRPPWELRRGAR